MSNEAAIEEVKPDIPDLDTQLAKLKGIITKIDVTGVRFYYLVLSFDGEKYIKRMVSFAPADQQADKGKIAFICHSEEVFDNFEDASAKVNFTSPEKGYPVGIISVGRDTTILKYENPQLLEA